MGDEQAWKHCQCFSEAYRRIRAAYIDAGKARPEVFEASLQSFLRATEKGKQLRYGGIEKYF